jgi:two-component system response regulator
VADIELTRLALAESRVSTRLNVVRGGEDAFRFLRREGEFQFAPRPHLILLDLNLPRIPGREVLLQIKNDVNLQMIPVIVLTTSSDERDVRLAYAGHANAYLVKPLVFEQLVETLRATTEYWLNTVTLPPPI